MGTLDDFSKNDKSSKPYDQFAGKKSTYNENMYTSKIDYSKVTADQKTFAEKMEKSINSSDAKGNLHIMEERG
jgi:PAB1-binding protein PBP1